MYIYEHVFISAAGQTNWMVRAIGANAAVYFCFNILYTVGGDQ